MACIRCEQEMEQHSLGRVTIIELCLGGFWCQVLVKLIHPTYFYIAFGPKFVSALTIPDLSL